MDQHKAEADFVLLAKMAVADEIERAEQACRIGRGISSSIDVFQRSQDHFLPELLNIVVRGHQPENLGSSFENLTFVIFNYDRCIERIFDSWTRMRFSCSAKEIAPKDNFIHAFGSLGDYFDREATGTFERQHGSALQNPHLELPELTSRLRVFTEQEDSAVADRIRLAASEAKVILFLGFGFEEQNMRFFEDLGSGNKHVFATLFGMKPGNSKFLSQNLSVNFNTGGAIYAGDLKSKELFNDFYHPLTSAVGSL